MITRLTGILESLDDGGSGGGIGGSGGAGAGIVVRTDGGLAYQLLLPAFWLARLRETPEAVGRSITLHTVHYLEGQGQGSSFIPRLLGFPRVEDRRFFELLTTVDGMGNRKALRTLAEEPGVIAAAIADRNIAWLTKLPEVGKKTAEKIVLELHAKVGPWLVPGDLSRATGAGVHGVGSSLEARPANPVAREAAAALVALGEQPLEAERLVTRAMARHATLNNVESVIAAVYAAR